MTITYEEFCKDPMKYLEIDETEEILLEKNGFFDKLTGADKFRPRFLYYSYRTIFVWYCPRSSAARG